MWPLMIIMIGLIMYLFSLNMKHAKKLRKDNIKEIKNIIEKTIVSIKQEDAKALTKFENKESNTNLLELLMYENISLKIMSRKIMSLLNLILSNKNIKSSMDHLVEPGVVDKLSLIDKETIKKIIILNVYKFGQMFYLNIKADDLKNEFILMRNHQGRWTLSDIEIA